MCTNREQNNVEGEQCVIFSYMGRVMVSSVFSHVFINERVEIVPCIAEC